MYNITKKIFQNTNISLFRSNGCYTFSLIYLDIRHVLEYVRYKKENVPKYKYFTIPLINVTGVTNLY